MRVTITTIAEKAGVSRGTVDKVIHNRPGVSPKVRERVQRVMEELDYRPNLVARALKTASTPRVIAVVMPGLSNSFFAEVKAGMDDAMALYESYGLRMELYHCDAINAGELLGILDYLEKKGVDGVAIRAVEDAALREKINGMSARGIPVVIYDSDLSDADTLCFIGENPIRSGRIAGSLMTKMLAPGAQVAIINGSRDLYVHSGRLKGFTSIAEAYGLDVVRTVDALEQRIIAHDETAAILRDYPELAGIFIVAGCRTDVCAAVCEMGRQSKLRIICYNYTADIIPLIHDGVIDFAISTEPRRQGYMVIEALFDRLFKGISPARRHIRIPLNIGMDQNLTLDP